MILADNGSPWDVTGMSDPRFDGVVLHELDRFTGADLEVVDTTGLVNGPQGRVAGPTHVARAQGRAHERRAIVCPADGPSGP